MPPKVIEIKWEGPLSLEEVIHLDDEHDFGGVYQIYGIHPLFGTDTLLYIGKAAKLKFKHRVGQVDKDWVYWDSLEIKIYIGHLGGFAPVEYEEWLTEIDSAEKILIAEFTPPYNAANIKTIGTIPYEEVVILNAGKRHRLHQSIFYTNHWKNSALGQNIWIKYKP